MSDQQVQVGQTLVDRQQLAIEQLAREIESLVHQVVQRENLYGSVQVSLSYRAGITTGLRFNGLISADSGDDGMVGGW